MAEKLATAEPEEKPRARAAWRARLPAILVVAVLIGLIADFVLPFANKSYRW
jgi:hypothetical protein